MAMTRILRESKSGNALWKLRNSELQKGHQYPR